MTRANTEQHRHTPWFAKAGAACSIVPIARFVGPNIFALKGGGYGCLFTLSGIDEEGLTDLELDSRMRSIEGALRGLPDESCLHQYARVMSGCDLPRQRKYQNSVTQVFVDNRLTFLEKTAGYRRIDLHWCLTLEPSKVKAFERRPQENVADTSRMLADLQKTATILESHLGRPLGLRVLGKAEAFQFFSYLFNLEDWANRDLLRSDRGVDRQLVSSPVVWHSDHLQIGRRHVQMFSLKTTPEASRPCLFSGLLTLDCDSVLCSTWRVKSTSAARSEIDNQEKFISFFKVGVLQRVMSGRDAASLETGAGAKAANNSVDDLGEVIRSLDKKAQGEYSLRLLLAGHSAEQLRDTTPAVHRITDERELYRDALRRGMSETTYSEVRAGFEARIAAGEFQLVPGQKHDSGRSFTTAETIRAEKEILRRMQQGQGRAEQIMSIQAAVAHTEKQQHLNAGQRSAAEEILTSRDVVQGLEGRAGVGKTTLLKSVREAAEKRGYVVEGFAPTSRAANQLRDAGISADTLQGFLVRARQPSPDRHLYMVDESSLASTKQVRDFLAKLESSDRVLLIGDTRQHQGVEAGKPFEQLVNAGMKTTQLDQIVRQRAAPELLKAVEHLSRGEVAEGVALLEQQGRVTEISDAQQRIAAVARTYAANPDNTIVVSPDNASRRQINQAVRSELQALGTVAKEDHVMRVLAPRSDMTGADRTWAARYGVDDILYYPRGSHDVGIEKQSYTKVIATQPNDNLLTVQREDGTTATYNPARLYGVTVYRELEREFAVGDRLQWTAPNKELGVANRDLGRVEQIGSDGNLTVRMDNGKSVAFNANEMQHFDHGYAVTSHSSQGLTAERVIVNIDSNAHRELINSRFAYVSVSRASHDAQIYTNDAASLVSGLSHDTTKTSAVEIDKSHDMPQGFEQGVGRQPANDTAAGFSL